MDRRVNGVRVTAVVAVAVGMALVLGAPVAAAAQPGVPPAGGTAVAHTEPWD